MDIAYLTLEKQKMPSYDEGDPDIWCLDCLRPTRVRKVDVGKGCFEATGYSGWHQDIRVESECCGDENHTEGLPEPETVYRALANHLKNDEDGLELASLLWKVME